MDIRLPNINAATEKEQLVQIKSYLYQFAEQMKWAIDTIDSGKNTSIFNANTGMAFSSSGGATNNKQSEVSNFDSVKELIIKSADIVDAYYEEINRRLEGKYVAQSTFGTYTEETSQTISETSKDVTRSFEAIETIKSDIETINSKVTNAYIQQGELGDRFIEGKEIELQQYLATADYINSPKPKDGFYEVVEFFECLNDIDDVFKFGSVPCYWSCSTGEGLSAGSRVKLSFEGNDGEWNVKACVLGTTIPIYGVEVGQTSKVDGTEVFDKFARFTSDRLSFYDKNDTEVAYISDYKLFITHAEITGSLKLGAYIIDTTNGLAFKWVGRS